MSQPQFVVCRRSVDRPYERVASLLREQPGNLLQRATASASARAASVAVILRVNVVGFEVGVNVRLHSCHVRETSGTLPNGPTLKLELAWSSARSPELFPPMLAELSTRPIDSTLTELEFRGSYWPPFGPVGVAIDGAVGRRIAEASIQSFLDDLSAQLRLDLPAA
jgi:hypothetical protein